MARSTFKVLFYVNGSKEKDGIVPIMGRVTINGTVAQFSCKRTIPKELWDVKGNRAKGKSKEAIATNLSLDNIKAQIILGYWQISRFNNAYAELALHSTYLGVGRSNGRFTPKILIILALDGDKRVSDSILMQGLTIFAAPQKLTQLHGMDYRDIDPAAIFPDKPRHQQALASALQHKD